MQITDKKTLRTALKQKRRAVPNEQRIALSRLIFDNLCEVDAYKKCDTVLVFLSTRIEVETMTLIKKAFADGKIVGAPRCEISENKMRFYSFSDTSELDSGAFDILEPKNGCPEVTAFDNAICIVPGLAFDKNGNRIGFGRGYYDRFLKDFSGISCGVCFDEFILDEIPTESTDIPVCLTATESRIIFSEK